MRCRRRSPVVGDIGHLALVILALSPLAVTETSKKKAESSAVSKIEVAREAPSASLEATQVTGTASTNSKSKIDVGTKDAPVDGLDGKPHAGPWVESGTEKGERPKEEDAKEEEKTKPSPRPLKDPPLPEVNDGVMDDPNRDAPKKGTTGTEGGVSEKDRDRKAQDGEIHKKPDPPKEVPPLPHSEQEKIGSKESGKESSNTKEKETVADSTEESDKTKELGGLEKPSDLPEKPHDIPHPEPPSGSSKDDDLSTPETGTDSETSLPIAGLDTSGLIQPLHSFVLSLTMILFSEVGDKTFLVAALMAMKHPRLVVFSAAFSALIAMTVLSAVLGHAVPTLVPKRLTNFLAAGLFLIFGAKMMREGLAMRPDEGVGEEMREVEMELEEKEHLARKQGRRRSSVAPHVLEGGRGGGTANGGRRSRSKTRLPSAPRSPSSSSSASSRPGSPSGAGGSSLSTFLVGFHNLFSLLLSPAWVQTFIMTFLGEWGDRSQIATIAMAAGQDYWWVTGGAMLGHGICTAAAVVGGRAIAGRVSMQKVTVGGAGAFLVFGVIYLVEGIFYS